MLVLLDLLICADGDVDGVTANGISNNGVTAWLNVGIGWTKTFIETSGGPFTRSVAVGDFDLDGKIDVVAALELSGQVASYRNLGSMSFAKTILTSACSCKYFLFFASADRHGTDG